MILDHLGIGVRDFAKSRAFYEQALAPLGASVVMEFPGVAGLGRAGQPQFWIHGTDAPPAEKLHIAFVAENREQVKAFHEAALAAGAKDNGAPGLRPQYHPNYYGAFVFDLDGNNIEAVCHAPEG